jgi:hypothetical protein
MMKRTANGVRPRLVQTSTCYHDITCSTSGFAWTLTPH